MKRLEFESPSERLSPTDVEDFEAILACKLPDTYRRFIIATNGGVPSVKNRRFVISSNPNFALEVDELSVDLFYRLRKPSHPLLSLPKVFEVTFGRVPPGTIPIASDSMGNHFLLGLTGELRDAVLFWDHEVEGFDPQEDPFHNVVLLASSFEVFVDALQEDEM